MEQRTDVWRESRRAKFTASEIHKLMGAKGLGLTGETYIYKKVAEYFGVEEEETSSESIRWGNDYEDMAKEYYSIAFDVSLKNEGFLIDDSGIHGCSPDAIIIGEEKGVEFKCPFVPTNHIKNMMLKTNEDLKKLHPEYYWQIQHCMLVTGFKVWDFVSFDPRFTGKKRMFAIEIKADTSDQALLIQRIALAESIKNQIINQINN